jgi:cytochrome c oxidase cbb3-type subunit 3
MEKFLKISTVYGFVLGICCLSCKRDIHSFSVEPPSADSTKRVRLTELYPGTNSKPAAVKNEYEENALALSEGKRLYSYMNCAGCHAHGGGGMGPPLMDEKWIYGSNPEQIFATIVEGRPNGMPSFEGKLPDFQVWQIAAYVRSLSGLASKGAAPGREDHMNGPPKENSVKKASPQNSSLPKSAEAPL